MESQQGEHYNNQAFREEEKKGEFWSLLLFIYVLAKPYQTNKQELITSLKYVNTHTHTLSVSLRVSLRVDRLFPAVGYVPNTVMFYNTLDYVPIPTTQTKESDPHRHRHHHPPQPTS